MLDEVLQARLLGAGVSSTQPARATSCEVLQEADSAWRGSLLPLPASSKAGYALTPWASRESSPGEKENN